MYYDEVSGCSFVRLTDNRTVKYAEMGPRDQTVCSHCDIGECHAPALSGGPGGYYPTCQHPLLLEKEAIGHVCREYEMSNCTLLK